MEAPQADSIGITTGFTHQCQRAILQGSPHRSIFHVISLSFPLFVPETHRSLGHRREWTVIAVLIGVPVCA